MKMLITGGAGFIGSAVVRMAIDRGHEVINVDCLTYAANLQNLQSVSDNKLYSFAKKNICDADAIRSIIQKHQPDTIMHLAAESHVDRSIDAPGTFIDTNVIGTYNLLEATKEYWLKLNDKKQEYFKFLHVSTDEVYGDLSPTCPAFKETTAYNPSSPYSASKAASDHLVRAWHRTYGLPIVITNCSNNYGPFQYPEKLIPVVLLKALHGLPIPVYGKGENIRDWLYVEDHADALLTVIQSGKVGETYNIGGNNERTNIELVQTLCDLMDKRKPNDKYSHGNLIEFVTDRPGHDRRYAVNANKISRDLGWSPTVSNEEGFEKTLDWYLKNDWWWKPLHC